ncbi:MAG: hypothetical protein EOO38_23515, partial [Cytophagaceae bacterium]
MRRNGSFPLDDNLTIAYSNPAMMRALVVGWIGARQNNSTFIDYANDQGSKILQLFEYNGADALSEYNAPTYYGIDMWALAANIKYGPKNASLTNAASTILPKLWTDVAHHWNGYLGNMVGPYDRAYTRDITQHSSVLGLVFWCVFGHAALPQPPKTEADLQNKMYSLMPKMMLALLIIFAGVSIYTPLAHPEIAQRWFSLPQLIYFSPVPILVLVFSFLAFRACKQRKELSPFIYTLALVLLAYTGFLISLWPYII